MSKPIFDFYDIESLQNVFTLANFVEYENHVQIFYLVDDTYPILPADIETFKTACTQKIYEKNKNFNGTVSYHDLHDMYENILLAQTFGLSDSKIINNPKQESSYPDYLRIICDSDEDYDIDKHPFLAGYNSNHYDTSMLAMYFHEIFQTGMNTPENPTGFIFTPTKASIMRMYNDDMFLPRFKNSKGNMESYLTVRRTGPGQFTEPDYSDKRWKIRKNMMLSGRHIDIARLNEKQQKVALKRILGMLGFQILESDKLKPGQNEITTFEQLLELIAYNVSDVVNLAQLAKHKVYKSNFELKLGLLQTYPELMYEQTITRDPDSPDYYKPDVSPYTVRRDRLTIDSSSAQFATKTLCPYGHLSDIPKVSFLYPDAEKAKELNIPQVNVLEESKKFFYANFPQPELRAKFDVIYNYYKAIEGKNFNESANYRGDFGDANGMLPDELRPCDTSDIPVPNTCMYYYKQDGTPSSCFINFSIGGIHGAEYNEKLYKHDCQEYENALLKYNQETAGLKAAFDYVMANYPTPQDVKDAKKIPLPDGTIEKPSTFINTKKLEWKTIPEFKAKEPELFKLKKNGTYKLNEKYAYTSADPSNHEDFTSYYPNLLRMLRAFFNPGLGYDRYGEIFDNKQKFGKLMKDESLPKAERESYATKREGTKLVLNSASGAADACFESNIRMNNRIISMRIIGQLFTWRIGQAQTIAGAKITSTNTDGLYSVLDPEINNPLLERESANINVEIEPELTYLVSKDANNRFEMNPDTGEIESASGGTLGCRKGPTPTQSLAHPAIIDWATTEYLVVASLGYKGLSLTKPLDRQIGMNILQSARKKFNDDIKTLTMFQNIVSSSTSSDTYIYYTKDADPTTPVPTQHYNRCFYVKDKTPSSVHLMAATAKKMTPATIKKRTKNQEPIQQHNPIAIEILKINGVNIQTLPMDYEAAIKKVTGIENEWYVLIENGDIHMMSDAERNELFDKIDMEHYLTLLETCFNENWRNTDPDDMNNQTPSTNTMPENPFETPTIQFDINTTVTLDDIIATKDYLLSVNTITKDNVDETIANMSERLIHTKITT